MKPVEFEGQNVVMGKDQPEYQNLPAHITKQGQVFQCWELSEDDKKMIQETGKIWVSQLTFNQPLQPILLSVETMVITKEQAERLI